ncbi:unnamed protein product [Lota lota]
MPLLYKRMPSSLCVPMVRSLRPLMGRADHKLLLTGAPSSSSSTPLTRWKPRCTERITKCLSSVAVNAVGQARCTHICSPQSKQPSSDELQHWTL